MIINFDEFPFVDFSNSSALMEQGPSKIIILFLLLLTGSITAQTEPALRFSNITIKEGLSHNIVNTIAQDSLGFLWLGTNEGLCRYGASEKIKIFRSGSPDNTLKSGEIRSLMVDSQDRIWIGTRRGGLTVYDPQREIWKTYTHQEDNARTIGHNDILSLLEDNSGNIWVGTENGLSLYHAETDDFTTHLAQKGKVKALQASAVLSIFEDNKGMIWVGTWDGGLHLVLPRSEEEPEDIEFRRFLLNENSYTRNVWDIYQDSGERYWLATHGGGMFLMDVPEEATDSPSQQDWEPRFLRYYKGNKRGGYSVVDNQVLSIKEDNNGDLWIGTVLGLCRISRENLPADFEEASANPDPVFNCYFSDHENPNSLTHNLVQYIYQDQQDILHFATQKGVSTYENNPKGIEHILLAFDNDDRSVSELYARTENEIYIGTNTDGLLRFNRLNGEITQVVSSVFKQKTILDLFDVSGDELLIACREGLFALNYASEEITEVLDEKQIIIDNETIDFRNIIKDSKGRVWGTSSQGLLRIFEKEKTFKIYRTRKNNYNTISDNSTTGIFEDARGDIWVGTYNGLNRMKNPDAETILFDRFYFDSNNSKNSIPDNRIMHFTSTEKRMYMGTMIGLCAYNYEEEKFENLQSFGFNHEIMTLIADEENRIWAATEEGILLFDENVGEYHLYDESYGFRSETFRAGVNVKKVKDDLLFTVRDALVRFSPHKIQKNTDPPPVAVTDLGILNPLRDTFIDVTHRSFYELNHNDYHLTFHYTALNFHQPEKNKFAFRLKGLEENWTYPEKLIPAVYTNLEPGNYTFEVKAANNDGVWSTESTKLDFCVNPAFWQTTWFRVGWVLLCLGLVYFIFKRWTLNMRRRNDTLSRFNKDLNRQVAERTEQLALKNKEIYELLAEIKVRNEELEKVVEQRTRRLKETNAELLQSNKDLEQFAYIASHDLQEPLRTIGNFVNLLGRRYANRLDEEANSYIRFAVDGVKRMSALIKGTLEYSGVGKKETEFEKVDLNRTIEQKLFDLSRKIQERKAVITKDEMPSIICNKDQIAMVFYNLINNALKFNKSEVPEVHIAFHEESSTLNYWKFSVKDNGIGIAPEYQKKIFEIFRRLHSSSEYEGTGIGLALCQKIIERHGGRIELESVPNQGTTFYFTIDKNLDREEDCSKADQFVVSDSRVS